MEDAPKAAVPATKFLIAFRLVWLDGMNAKVEIEIYEQIPFKKQQKQVN